ncbi:Phospholipid:diacylglycerol acyltransferase [Cyphellophora attinorum]|uniref:Phospholipid:diacylglycerol acyltransferase n=1 Tax=Cyphellophora attinorum TaxID=1664694 RepID=A0A0N1NXA1_9EURO|nr:Phospholipid:diacylglycerol acyltransferase [Phialophora attinorum]KPI37340.1 Phospholipid:diacylglycerol acyltransferase [Phialophora attinorum]
MSELRRRVVRTITGGDSPGISRAGTPEPGEETKVVSKAGFEKLLNKKTSKRRSSLLFVLGGLFGLVIAVFFAQQQEVVKLEGLLDLNLDSVFDVLPVGLVRDAKALSKAERDAVNYDSFSVGLHLQSQGVTAKHPVIMIPGVISTGLESWGTAESSRPYFRKRLWGSWSMMRALVLDQASWKRHIMLDKETGLDPPDIKLRAAQGFDAADFFITGYWIWNKILENLATIGYDPTNAFTAAYDWRLSYINLEVRDKYFTRLKNYIEVAQKTSGLKPVLVSHSMGSQVLFHFFKWVEHKDYGKGGPKWVNDHIDSWINISGCMLGAAKDIPAVLSGEMKDTAQLNAFAVYGLEKFLAREERAEIFRAMPGISSMLPKGGDAVWGNMTWAPDDALPDQNTTQPSPAVAQQGHSFGQFISFKPPRNTSLAPPQNFTMSSALDYLLNVTEPWYRDQILSSYSHGVAHTKKEVEHNENDPRKWLNPLEARLPLAPDLKIYCFYGIGKPTERAYFYKEHTGTPLPGVHTNTTVNITIDTGFTTKVQSQNPDQQQQPQPNEDGSNDADTPSQPTSPNKARPNHPRPPPPQSTTASSSARATAPSTCYRPATCARTAGAT